MDGSQLVGKGLWGVGVCPARPGDKRHSQADKVFGAAGEIYPREPGMICLFVHSFNKHLLSVPVLGTGDT